MAELREAMQAHRCPHDPLSVLLGRCAQVLTAAGEVDPELALSLVVWPTPALLEAVARATPTPPLRQHDRETTVAAVTP